jgi:hypothetical protein
VTFEVLVVSFIHQCFIFVIVGLFWLVHVWHLWFYKYVLYTITFFLWLPKFLDELKVLYLSETEKIKILIIAFEIVTIFVVCLYLLHLWLFIANNPMESTITTHLYINLSS